MLISAMLLLSVFSLLVFIVPVRVKAYVSLGIQTLSSIFFSVLAVAALVGYKPVTYFSFVSDAGLFAMDALSAIFVLVVSIVALSVGIYAVGYLKHPSNHRPSSHISLHLFCLLLLYFSLVGVLCANDGYYFLVSWELMTISSFILILFDAHKREVIKAALNYIVLMHICFVFLLVGFVSVAKAGLPVAFDSLGVYFEGHSPLPLFIVFLIGFGIKAGIFPLHIWLPDSYTAAPAYVSAIMSGAMSKMGVYALLRVLSYINTDLYTIGLILLIVGVVTALWGVILSTMQADIKRLLAYSSIENLGIIFIAIGAAVIGRAEANAMLTLCAISGALFHVVSHSMLKSVLFFGAGNVATQTGTTNMEELGGIAKNMPMTAIFTVIGLMAICALPPLCGFASEFMIYLGFFTSVASGTGEVISSCAILAMALIGGVAVVSFTKLYGVVFCGESRLHNHNRIAEVDSQRIVAFVPPVMVIIIAGILPALVVSVIMPAAAPYVGIDDCSVYLDRVTAILMQVTKVVLLLVGIVALLLVVRKMLLRRRTVSQSPTWGCGFTAPTERMQYSGESFSEGLHTLVGSLSKNRIDGEVVGKDEIFPDKHSFKIGHKDRVNELFSLWWVELLHKINVRVMALRTGKVNYYILYALLFFAIIFLLTILNII